MTNVDSIACATCGARSRVDRRTYDAGWLRCSHCGTPSALPGDPFEVFDGPRSRVVVLRKPGRLTAEEFDVVRRHEDVSVEILTTIDFLAPVAPSATSEAAQFSPVADDHGQPIEPHIVAVADAYDAMTSTRSYRRALSQDIAFAELRKNSGRQFHPRVVDALIAALRRRGAIHGDGHELYVHHLDAPRASVGSAGLGDLLPPSGANGPGGAGGPAEATAAGRAPGARR